jgi:ketopantoate hydroxymethyltransferase
MTTTRIAAAIVAATATALAVTAPASAHYVTVMSNGTCVVQHVGQFPPGHHSMGGHSTAASHEQSAVVRFGAPGTC